MRSSALLPLLMCLMCLGLSMPTAHGAVAYVGNFTGGIGTSTVPFEAITIGLPVGVQAITQLAEPPGRFWVIGGKFSQIGDVELHALAMYDTSTFQWSRFGAQSFSSSATVYAIASTKVYDSVAHVSRNALFVGGSFNEKMNAQEGVATSGTFVSNFAFHNGAGWEDVSFNRGFDGPVYTIACMNNGTGADDVYVGGNFRQTSDYTESFHYVVKGVYSESLVNVNGVQRFSYRYTWTALAANTPQGAIYSIALCGWYLFIGGEFSSGIKYLNPSTNKWSVVEEGFDAPVRALACFARASEPDLLYAGGEFKFTDGVIQRPISYLAVSEVEGPLFWAQIGRQPTLTGPIPCTHCTGKPLSSSVRSLVIHAESTPTSDHKLYAASGPSVVSYQMDDHPHALSPTTVETKSSDSSIFGLMLISGASSHMQIQMGCMVFAGLLHVVCNM